MTICITFMLGATAGVVLMRCVTTLRASQKIMLNMFIAGVILGMVAAVMCLAPWAEKPEEQKGDHDED